MVKRAQGSLSESNKLHENNNLIASASCSLERSSPLYFARGDWLKNCTESCFRLHWRQMYVCLSCQRGQSEPNWPWQCNFYLIVGRAHWLNGCFIWPCYHVKDLKCPMMLISVVVIFIITEFGTTNLKIPLNKWTLLSNKKNVCLKMKSLKGHYSFGAINCGSSSIDCGQFAVFIRFTRHSCVLLT